jgi:hypothetical protein
MTKNGRNKKHLTPSQAIENANHYYDLENNVNSQTNIIAHSQIVSDIDNNFNWLNIFCFGIAGLPYHLMFSAIGVYSTKFLLDEAKIPARYTSVILFVSRAIDAITDPIYGHFLNLTPVTRFGKMKPW